MTQWIDPPPVVVPDALREDVGGHPLIAETLVRLGIQTPEKARGYLYPDQYHPTSAFELPDMLTAVERIEQAFKKGERICIWGDFDVDGQTATSVLVEGLRKMGADVMYHIPVRALESHGMNIPNLKKVITQGADLIVTCDTGIAENEPLNYAREMGVDVVVTDHHTLPEELPAALALVNPQFLDAGHPLRTLPGVGVAYKLIEALYERAGLQAESKALLDLVALGIVADLAELRGDTRFLLQLGLDVLRATKRVGLLELFKVARIQAATVNEETIGFGIGPRMNALGRLDDANPIVEFLTTDDPTLASVTANRLEGLNEERRMITEQIYQGAAAQLQKDPQLTQFEAIVLAQENWEAGIIGIVASRLVEEYHKPAVLIALDGSGIGRGSARSVEGVNITEAIAAQRDMLRTFGGHPMAAGLSLNEELIERFRLDLSETIRKSPQGPAVKKPLAIGAYLDLHEITFDLISDIQRLGPFGAGNPPLTFAAHRVSLRNVSRIGRNQDHLRLVIAGRGDERKEVFWWRGREDDLPEGPFDLAFTMRVSEFNGERSIQVTWVDARPVEEPEEAAGKKKKKGRIVHDFRDAASPEDILYEIAAEGAVEIWGESCPTLDGLVKNRNQLEKADRLVIWTVPPSAVVLNKVLAKVKPDEVYLFAEIPEAQRVRDFLSKMAGLMNYVVKNNDGSRTLSELSAATAQTDTAVVTALNWLQAAGHFDWNRKGRRVDVRPGSGKKDPGLTEIHVQVSRLLSETNAYRRSYLKTDAEQLIQPK